LRLAKIFFDRLILSTLVCLVSGACLLVSCAEAKAADTSPPQGTGAIAVPYRMPVDGELTLGLFDKSGQLLKWIVQDEYRYAGENTQLWDGLDQRGNPVAAGDYELKAVYHPLLSLEYLLTVAAPGTPPWPTPDDRGDWLSDEATPQAAATDGKWVFLAAPGSEKGFSVIALDEKGQRRWGVPAYFNPRSVALAASGDDLYVLFSGPESTDRSRIFSGGNAIGRAILLCLDKKTGRPAKFTLQTPQLRVATWPYRDAVSFLWDLRNKKSFSPFNYGGPPRYFDLDIGESTDALGIAAAADKLYISMPYENKLLVLDAQTGTPAGGDIPLPSPAGLAALDDHTLIAVSGTQVVKVDLGTKKVSSFISTGLDAPDSIALDSRGRVYVSDWGASFQVKAFDRAGRFIRAFGTPGGRPWVGKWDAHGMLLPRGIAVTTSGKLWVAEDDGSPKRFSVWNTATGAFIRDYIGPAPYGGGTFFWIDPKDSTEVHAEGTKFKVDYDRKTVAPVTIDYRKADQNTPFTPNGHNLDGRQVRILYHGGHEYAFMIDSWKMASVLQRQGDLYQPVAALGSFPYDPKRELTPDSDSIFNWDSDLGIHVFAHYFPAFFAGHMENNYAWSDTNGDHLVQPAEMQWIPTTSDKPYSEGAQGLWKPTWNFDMGPDFSVYFPERFSDRTVIMQLPVKQWTRTGAPVYDLHTAKAIVSLPAASDLNAIHVTNDHKLIVAYNYESAIKNNPDSIECFDLNGKSLWSIAMPVDLTGENVHANCVAYDYRVPGIGDVVCTWLYHGSEKPYFFTTDGLYIGTALDDTLLGPSAIWSESSKYFYQSTDGTPYLINGANQQEHIFKIKGLGEGGRFQGSLVLSQADVDRATTGRSLPQAIPPPQPVIRISWLKRPPVIDGDLSDWNLNDGVRLDAGNGRAATVVLGRDENNLYLACQVNEPTPPLRNGGADWRTLYTTGDCVDLMLGTGSRGNPYRRDAAPGDERLLFSVFQNRPIAVLYQPVVAHTGASVHLGSAQVDRIIRLDSARVAVKRGEHERIYTLEAAVPLNDLSIDPNQKKPLLGDVGVIYADESGRNRAQRLYYYNKNTDVVADLPTETRLQPNEWGPIDFPLGPNLLQNGSFEKSMVSTRDQEDRGWFISQQQNGNNVTVIDQGAHGGRHALLMETRVPPTVPASEYSDPDYETFLKSFNRGTGDNRAEITQTIPVKAGHLYSVRFFYRNEDFHAERKETGHPRGYISFAGRLDWHCSPPNHDSSDSIGETKEDHPDWQEMTDYQHGYDLPRPHLAPEGATSATISFELVTRAEGHFPRVVLDDVEMVDVSPLSPTK
jgi:hypothetical protein